MISTVTEDLETHNRLNYAYDLSQSIRADECRADFYEFLKEFWDEVVPDPLIDNWHIKYICDELQLRLEKYINKIPQRDLVINVPPGSSKTTICTIMFPVWCWVVRPKTRILSGSFEGELARDMSVKSRDLIRSMKFQEFYPGEIEFKADSDKKGYYQNLDQGSRTSTSIGASPTGRHADFSDIDDPINPKDSQSAVKRKTANDWMEKTLPSRKTDKILSFLLLIMQRLNEDDPSGRKLNSKKGADHICLPAEITELDNVYPKELEEFYVDGLLDPVRMPREVLDDAREVLGSLEYGGQYLQSPMDAEGNIFKRDWFQLYDELPMEKPTRIIQSWDTAFKKEQQNDYTVCTTWKQFTTGYYLVGFWMQKVEYPELKKQIRLENENHRPHEILVEDKASGISALQELKHLNLNLKGIIPLNDKIARANQVTPTFEAGNVYFPVKDFTDKIIEQMTGFPNTTNDDIVDSVTQFLNYAREKPTTRPIVVSSGRRQTKRLLRGYNAKTK